MSVPDDAWAFSGFFCDLIIKSMQMKIDESKADPSKIHRINMLIIFKIF
jgi:hypothetical protein